MMTNKQKIQKLNYTINRLKKLKPEQFNYRTYVYDWNGNCGSVCCVAGWYPKWFPSSNIIWKYNTLLGIDTTVSYLEIREALSIYHGLSRYIINYLFYGDSYNREGFLSIIEQRSTTPEQVVKRFERIVNELKENKI